MGIQVNQNVGMTPVPGSNAVPAVPNASDVNAFNSLMNPTPATATQKLATDAQIATIPKGDIDRLRAKWGNDDAGFREEAYGLWEFGQNFANAIVTQTLNDEFKRMQERIKEIREG